MDSKRRSTPNPFAPALPQLTGFNRSPATAGAGSPPNLMPPTNNTGGVCASPPRYLVVGSDEHTPELRGVASFTSPVREGSMIFHRNVARMISCEGLDTLAPLSQANSFDSNGDLTSADITITDEPSDDAEMKWENCDVDGQRIIKATFVMGGAQGEVSQVTLANGRVLAVKKMRITLGVDNGNPRNASVIRELRTAFSLGQKPSPYLVKFESALYHQSQVDTLVLLYMEWMRCNAAKLLEQLREYKTKNKGVDFAEQLMRFVLPVFAHDVLQGLSHLHNDLSRCHNDLKLDNILLRQDGKGFKVADFGCSLDLGPEGHAVEIMSLGNEPKRPPERHGDCRQHPATGAAPASEDARTIECYAESDVWSLGLMLVEAYDCGERIVGTISPFGGRNTKDWQERVDKILSKLPKNDDFSNFVSQCLVPNVSERCSAAKLLQHRWLKQHSADALNGLRDEMAALLTGVEDSADDVAKLTEHYVSKLNEAAKKLSCFRGDGGTSRDGMSVSVSSEQLGLPSSPSKEYLERASSSRSSVNATPTTNSNPKKQNKHPHTATNNNRYYPKHGFDRK